MSMPSYPPDMTDVTREQAVNMIVASIAMEECALSHIINAEGEKLQYILGRLDGTCGPQASTKEVLEVNKSITKLLDVVAQNQMLLRNKLALALEESSPPPECPPAPCPPPCHPEHPCCPEHSCCPEDPCRPERPPHSCGNPVPPCSPQKSVMQLTGQCGRFLWSSGCSLPWECGCRRGTGIHWSRKEPGTVWLDAKGTYLIQYTLNICDFIPVASSGRICIAGEPEEAVSAPPLWFSIRCSSEEPTTLQYSTVLFPSEKAKISLRLHARSPLCVEQAVLNIVEL